MYPSWGDYYCVHLQALFSPDETGEYTFAMIGDDFAMLFIGDSDQAASRKLVAQMGMASSDLTLRYLSLIKKENIFGKKTDYNSKVS